MTSNKPVTVDGKTYDLFGIQMAISGRYTEDGNVDASVVMTLQPIRVSDGVVEQASEGSQTILFGSLVVADDDARVAVGEIQAALQKYLDARGI